MPDFFHSELRVIIKSYVLVAHFFLLLKSIPLYKYSFTFLL